MIRNAAEFTFSWSLRRQRCGTAAARKYFLHYYAARGGHDPDSGGELRRIHEMRSLLSERAYLHRLIAAELRRRFYRPHEEEDAELPDSEAGPYGAVSGRLRPGIPPGCSGTNSAPTMRTRCSPRSITTAHRPANC